MPRDEAFRIIAAIVGALEFAHRKHIVHGDLKPGNVIVTDGRRRQGHRLRHRAFPAAAAGGRARRPKTGEGNFSALTPPYASPEMHDGAEPDPRDDIYALACIAYELLAGEHPFDAHAVDQGARSAAWPFAPSKRSARARIPRACSSALQFDRNKRTPSAQQFLDELNGHAECAPQRAGRDVDRPSRSRAAGGDLRGPDAEDIADRGDARGGARPPATVFRDCPTCPLMACWRRARSSRVPPRRRRRAALRATRARRDDRAIHSRPACNEVTVGEFAEFAQGISARARRLRHLRRRVARTRRRSSWRNATPQQNAIVPGDLRDLAGRVRLRRMAVAAHRLDLSFAERFRVGIPRARGIGRRCRGRTPAAACASANVADVERRAALSRLDGFRMQRQLR